MIIAFIAFIVLSVAPRSNAAFIMKNTGATFEEAKHSCEQLKDGRLVTIHNEEIQSQVEELIKESGGTSWIWIGMNVTIDLTTNKYQLRWLDGTVLEKNGSYSNYHWNILNIQQNMHCCAISAGDWVPLGWWTDIDCTEKLRYICEYMPDINCANSQECPVCLDERTVPDCHSGSCRCKALCTSTTDCPECSSKNGNCRSCVNGGCECKAECASNDECPGCYSGDKKHAVCVNGKCICNALPNPKTCTSYKECDQSDCEAAGKLRSCQAAGRCDCEVERAVKELIMSNDKLDFFEAMAACGKMREGRLAIITNEKIQEKVVDIIRRRADLAWIWIGLNGTGKWADASYNLKWLDGTELNQDTTIYSNFRKNIFNRNDKLCGAIAGGYWATIGTWLDIRCAEKRRYICEYMPEIKCNSVEKCPTCLDSRKTSDCLNDICVCKEGEVARIRTHPDERAEIGYTVVDTTSSTQFTYW